MAEPIAMMPTGNDQRSQPESVVRGLDRAMRCVCAIEGAGPRAGTGMLIAPDLVLTNYHVVESLIGPAADFSGAECRFDYREDADGNLLQTGGVQTVFKIRAIVIASPPSPGDLQGGGDDFKDDQLDFAILRIEAPAGRLNDCQGRQRGWTMLPYSRELPDPDIDMEICILQHPYQEGGLRALQPLKTDYATIIDVRGVNGASARYIHDGKTRSGSSGGPCFSTVDRFAFTAIHNASLDKKSGDKTRGQAISLRRIAKHIEKFYEQPGGMLGQAPPKDATPDARERQRVDSIERRKKAALCLMDRASEENEFLARIFAAKSDQQAPYPLLHLVICRDSDAYRFFMERLTHLTFEIKPDAIDRSKLEALTKGLSPPTRTPQVKAWPQQTKEDKLRRKDLANMLMLLDVQGRHLLLLNQVIDNGWSPATEEPLLRDFAAMIAAKFNGSRDGIQAVVFFIVADGTADAVATEFSGLWQNSVPANCGVCVELSRVGRSDLDEWSAYLENAWAANTSFSDAIRSQFDGARLKPLDAVAKGLNDSLSKYIADTLDKIGLPGEPPR